MSSVNGNYGDNKEQLTLLEGPGPHWSTHCAGGNCVFSLTVLQLVRAGAVSLTRDGPMEGNPANICSVTNHLGRLVAKICDSNSVLGCKLHDNNSVLGCKLPSVNISFE